MNGKRDNETYLSIEKALDLVIKQKELYEQRLVNKQFLFLFVNNKDEITHSLVEFRRNNYLHLTGLDYKNIQFHKRSGFANKKLRTKAIEFYDRLGSDDSLIKDVSFIKGRTKKTTRVYNKYTQYKLANLSQLTSLSTKASYIGKYKGERGFDIIINKNNSSVAFVDDDGTYIPVSSLFGKPELLATDIHPILAIISKEKAQKEFKMQYLNSKVKLDKAMFSKNTFDLLDISSFDNPKVKFNETQRNALIHAFKATTRKYLQIDIDNIEQLQAQPFNSTDDIIRYSRACKLFEKSLDTKLKVDIATELLHKKQEHIKNPEDYILIGCVGKSIENAEKALNDDNSDSGGSAGASASYSMGNYNEKMLAPEKQEPVECEVEQTNGRGR